MGSLKLFSTLMIKGYILTKYCFAAVLICFDYPLAGKNTAKFSLPGGLRAWCKQHLKEDVTHPTCNQIRKWVRWALMQLTDSKEKLKAAMVIIDAHSKCIQDRVYVLRFPKEDMNLATQTIFYF